MSSENPSIMSHVSIGTNDLEAALAFYDAVMPVIGGRRVEDLEEAVGAVAYGRMFPEFWVNVPLDDKPAETANGVHFAFMASSREQVHEFWDVAIAAGATPDGEPGPRAHYGQAYYGCFLKDLDGHKIEVMHWDQTLSESV